MSSSCVFEKCCCCIELRTGCLIMGYLNLIGEAILTIIAIVGLVGGGVVASHAQEQKEKDAGLVILIVSIIFLLVCIFLIAFTIVLLVGLHKNKPGHVKAYLIIAVIGLVLSIIMFLASFGGNKGVDAMDIVTKLIYFTLNIYFLLVIRSQYIKMKEDTNKRPAIYHTA